MDIYKYIQFRARLFRYWTLLIDRTRTDIWMEFTAIEIEYNFLIKFTACLIKYRALSTYEHVGFFVLDSGLFC